MLIIYFLWVGAFLLMSIKIIFLLIESLRLYKAELVIENKELTGKAVTIILQKANILNSLEVDDILELNKKNNEQILDFQRAYMLSRERLISENVIPFNTNKIESFRFSVLTARSKL